MTDYTTLATVKARVKITDANDDATLSTLITAASNAIDRWCKRPFGGFVGVTETRIFDVPDTIAGPIRMARDVGIGTGQGFVIGIPVGYATQVEIDPLLSATSVQTDEDGDLVYEVTWSATGTPPDYDLLPINAALDGQYYRQIRALPGGAHQFPVGERRLSITGTWGVATAIPPLIQEAAILTTVRWFKRQDAPFGVMGDATTGMMHIPALDPDVVGMLDDAGMVEHWLFA